MVSMMVVLMVMISDAKADNWGSENGHLYRRGLVLPEWDGRISKRTELGEGRQGELGQEACLDDGGCFMDVDMTRVMMYTKEGRTVVDDLTVPFRW
eukprot:54374-Eustigmatos_ZCMA.PRE.2